MCGSRALPPPPARRRARITTTITSTHLQGAGHALRVHPPAHHVQHGRLRQCRQHLVGGVDHGVSAALQRAGWAELLALLLSPLMRLSLLQLLLLFFLLLLPLLLLVSLLWLLPLFLQPSLLLLLRGQEAKVRAVRLVHNQRHAPGVARRRQLCEAGGAAARV